LPDFSWYKRTKRTQNVPNGHKYLKCLQNISNGHKIYQHFPI
jgi:hypothetical protein